MPTGRLSPIQERVLEILATIEPRWTLTGGGALVGFYTRHRETRDVDLFFRGELALGTVVDRVKQALTDHGLELTVLRTARMFAQLEARDRDDSIVIDLVADPTPIAESPGSMTVGKATILVDTAHQLLVNKLLSRSELRDLVDVRALIAQGGDLPRALRDCPRQDSGFSPLTFGWAMKGLALERIAAALGLNAPEIADLVRFRDELVDRVVAEARP